MEHVHHTVESLAAEGSGRGVVHHGMGVVHADMTASLRLHTEGSQPRAVDVFACKGGRREGRWL